MIKSVFIALALVLMASNGFPTDYSANEKSKETVRDARFIANSNGTVLDTRTGLMWGDSDNGEDINWPDAKKYCEDYTGGLYSDWRMPTLDELAGLYNTGQEYRQECCSSCSKIRITQLIKLTCCCVWATEADDYGAAHFTFRNGHRNWRFRLCDYGTRALPVRGGN